MKKQLLSLSKSLLKRLHTDLVEDTEAIDPPMDDASDAGVTDEVHTRAKRWMAFPKASLLAHGGPN